jgi:hypothetical protein
MRCGLSLLLAFLAPLLGCRKPPPDPFVHWLEEPGEAVIAREPTEVISCIPRRFPGGAPKLEIHLKGTYDETKEDWRKELHGRWIAYDEAGEVILRAEFMDGLLLGGWRYGDTRGAPGPVRLRGLEPGDEVRVRTWANFAEPKWAFLAARLRKSEEGVTAEIFPADRAGSPDGFGRKPVRIVRLRPGEIVLWDMAFLTLGCAQNDHGVRVDANLAEVVVVPAQGEERCERYSWTGISMRLDVTIPRVLEWCARDELAARVEGN